MVLTSCSSSTIQIFHSVDNAPLQAVTQAVANGKSPFIGPLLLKTPY
jgi:hypothetical protein